MNEITVKKQRKPKHVIVAPALRSFVVPGKEDDSPRHVQIQVSAHKVSGMLRREVALVFPDLKALQADDLDVHAVATMQRCGDDMLAFTTEAELQKNQNLLNFVAWAHALREAIGGEYWCDFIDPCSGLPELGTRGSTIYDEVQGMRSLLGYRTEQVAAGCAVCHVILHPTWGSRCYPASFFTTCPSDKLQEALDSIHTN